MGFGKKTDLSTGKTLDLDKTYKNIIKPAVEKSGLQCVRADEIQDSGLIDKSMYALLMHSDLVVADIQHIIQMRYMNWVFGTRLDPIQQ